MNLIRAKVFVDPKTSNRFIIPGMWSDGTKNTRPMSSVIIDAMMFRVLLGLDDGGEIEIPADKDGVGQIANRSVDMLSSRLAHGGCTVFCISGPLFDDGERPEAHPSDDKATVERDEVVS